MDDVELLSPAGDFETALAAFEAGADAVYCGLADFSARAFAHNFSLDDLRNIVAYSRAKGGKVYVTFNTLVDEADMDGALEILARIDEIGPDAIIVQDLGVARICRKAFPSLALHASTQLVAHNLEGVLALKDLGFTRVVLARELSLEEISSISRRCGGVELECFVHGALCYSISGLCLFSAMEKGRSGNRGKCAYCCRLPYDDGEGRKTLAFSMKDLRLGEDVRRLADAGVASLKIEGRMKSALYVASVTKYYRQLLGRPGVAEAAAKGHVTVGDLETVFSRRTTELYLDGRNDDVIDPVSLGHLGTPVGTVKRVTKDRDGRSWLRFHTTRALERHDGLQFASPGGGKPLGFGISEMRQAISRANVFEVPAGTDVEILLPEEGEENWTQSLRGGDVVYCSMSNAVKRMFPVPGFRPSDYPGGIAVDVAVGLSSDAITAKAELFGECVACSVSGRFDRAKNPDKTCGAVEKAFSKLGETAYSLGRLTVMDPDRLFAPMSVLNDLRRELVERLDAARDAARRRKLGDARAISDASTGGFVAERSLRTVKLRADQKLPSGDWNEVVLAVSPEVDVQAASGRLREEIGREPTLRLALPVYTAEPKFNRLRAMVKRLLREGFGKWEASDLATLRMLKAAGVSDITADWTLYAFNASALAGLTALGVSRFVASPENERENLQFLAESGYDIEFLAQQSTPLFISLTKPAAEKAAGLAIFRRDGLWVTTRAVPRVFDLPRGASSRIDLSWSAQ